MYPHFPRKCVACNETETEKQDGTERGRETGIKHALVNTMKLIVVELQLLDAANAWVCDVAYS